MKSHLLEIKNDFTGSINNLNDIMKGRNIFDILIEIDSKYGKTNPIFSESSKKIKDLQF